MSQACFLIPPRNATLSYANYSMTLSHIFILHIFIQHPPLYLLNIHQSSIVPDPSILQWTDKFLAHMHLTIWWGRQRREKEKVKADNRCWKESK